MTSVQNRPLLSSGNKISFSLLIVALFLLSSCDLFTPIQTTTGTRSDNKNDEEELDDIRGGRVYNPETGEFENAEAILTEEMVTVQWEEVPTSEYEPIGSDRTTPIDTGGTEEGGGGEEIDLRERYDVALLLPFLSNRFNVTESEINKNSKWAIQFYAGSKLALKKLEEEGVNLNVSVFDTEAKVSKVNQLLQKPSVSGSHLIMGSVDKECAKRIATFAKNNEVPFVSPYIASRGIADENPYYIQIKPTLATHLEVLTKHIKENHKTQDVVLVRREDNREATIMQYIQQLNEDISGSSYATPFSEAIINDETATLENFEVQPILKPGSETVFVVTSWADKSFIYSFLQKAFNATRDLNHKITVYGMPQWQAFKDADYEYYEKLNLHISSEQYIDGYSADIREFKKAYFDEYGSAPTTEAFRGYDDMLYFGRMLKKYGLYFYEYFNEAQEDAFHTRFELAPVTQVTTDDFGQEQYGNVERFENQFVYVLKFENYHFQPTTGK